mmetsp:Transcript_33316/g.84142  ORF Transcript_33316/g.84142 Transcript_33316/m.84142 type:complete len:324 (-) Transcript_33316:344-1315(-)
MTPRSPPHRTPRTTHLSHSTVCPPSLTSHLQCRCFFRLNLACRVILVGCILRVEPLGTLRLHFGYCVSCNLGNNAPHPHNSRCPSRIPVPWQRRLTHPLAGDLPPHLPRHDECESAGSKAQQSAPNILSEVDFGHTVEVVADRKGQQGAEPQQEYQLEALPANCLINRLKLAAPSNQILHPAPQQHPPDEKRARRRHSGAEQDNQGPIDSTKEVACRRSKGDGWDGQHLCDDVDCREVEVPDGTKAFNVAHQVPQPLLHVGLLHLNRHIDRRLTCIRAVSSKPSRRHACQTPQNIFLYKTLRCLRLLDVGIHLLRLLLAPEPQ